MQETPVWFLGWGRSPREGIGYPLQYSWASLVAQMVRNPPSMQETWVRSLGWEDPLEEDMATHSSILSCLKNPHGQRSLAATVHGVTKSWTWLSNWAQHTAQSELLGSIQTRRWNEMKLGDTTSTRVVSICWIFSLKQSHIHERNKYGCTDVNLTISNILLLMQS